MKVTIIKGPMFEQRQKEAISYIKQIVQKKIDSGQYEKDKQKAGA